MHCDRFVAAALLMLTALVTGCGVDGPDGWLSETSMPHEAAGVGVVAEGCSLVAQLGSAVVIERRGQVVTAAHTIAGATSIAVVDSAGAELLATVQAFDPDADLAVLHVADLDVEPRALAASTTLGDASVVRWDRDGVTAVPVEITRRLTITIEDIYIDDVVERSGIEFAGEVQVGDSGGAVIDANGDVVGIVYGRSRSREVGFATDIAEISDVLSSVDGSDVTNGRCP